MTTPSAPVDTTPAASTPVSPAVMPAPAPPSWPWRRGALILVGAAQLITISDLVTSDFPLAATWWSLLLGIAPAPLAAAAAFAPAPVNLVAAVVGVLVLVAGIAGGSCISGCCSSRRLWCLPSAPSSCGASGGDRMEVCGVWLPDS